MSRFRCFQAHFGFPLNSRHRDKTRILARMKQSTLPSLQIQDLSAFFDHNNLIRGMDYAQNNKVRGWSYQNGLIESEVFGSARQIYQQEIQLIIRNGALVGIDSDCTCPVAYDCKHVVAVLVKWIEHQKQQQPTDSTTTAEQIMHQRWLKQVQFNWQQRVQEREAHAAAAKTNSASEFHYGFTLSLGPQGRDYRLQQVKVKANREGQLKATRLQLDRLNFDRSDMPLNAAEIETLAFFDFVQGFTYQSQSYQPQGKKGALLLQKIAETVPLYWQQTIEKQTSLQRLSYRQSALAQPCWLEQGEERQLGWQVNGEPVLHLLKTSPPWYITAQHIGPLQLDPLSPFSADELQELVQQAPRLKNLAEASALSQQMLADEFQHILPLPLSLPEVAMDKVKVQPRLLLGSSQTSNGVVDYAVLEFVYAGISITADYPQELLRQSTATQINLIRRERQTEQALLNQLQTHGFYELAMQTATPANCLGLADTESWLQFVQLALPELIQQGWQVDYLPGFRYNLLQVDEWYAEVDESGKKNAWFELELGLVVNQQKIPLLPILLQLLRETPHDFRPEHLQQIADDKLLLVQLDQQHSVALPYGRIKSILSTLGELYFKSGESDKLTLTELDSARLAELQSQLQLRWNGGEKLRELGQKIREFDGIKMLSAPAGLNANLRDYQLQGLAWLQFLREYKLAGILADDMGLGKTLQTLAHIQTEKVAGRLQQPALVIAPTSLIDNWQAEAQRFCPDLKVLALHGKQRAQLFTQIAQAELVLTSYALLPRDEETLRQQRFHLVILDEAQYIKNHKSKMAQIASMLTANHRLCLTGTPLQNHLGELWSQFNFLMPGLLGDEKNFNQDFRQPVEKQADSQRLALLNRRLKPFILRRTKDKVATELPAKTEITRYIELDQAQADLYETVRLTVDEKIRAEIAKKGLARSQITILDALLKLRQVCCDPRLLKLRGSSAQIKQAGSAKLDELMEMLDELIAEGRRILIFSQFTSMLELIASELQARSYAYLSLTGSSENRGALVEQFQSGQIPVFLISLKAGGVGLNLTAADTVIHYDPWWNPAAENQATDRAWRMGQDKPVFVYRLIAKGTLEEKIQQMQQQKASLAQALLDQGSHSAAALEQDDLLQILSPLQS